MRRDNPVNKETYLRELARYLKSLPKLEQDEILGDYEAHFEHAAYRGRSEEETARGLGQPKLIAREVLAQLQVRKAGISPTLATVTKAALATAALGTINLVLVLVPFLGSLFLLGCCYLLALALLGSPVIMLIQHGLTVSLLSDLFLMLGYIGLGIILILGLFQLTKWYFRQTVRYLNYNLQMVERRYKNVG